MINLFFSEQEAFVSSLTLFTATAAGSHFSLAMGMNKEQSLPRSTSWCAVAPGC
jgi:hypothetical protein